MTTNPLNRLTPSQLRRELASANLKVTLAEARTRDALDACENEITLHGNAMLLVSKLETDLHKVCSDRANDNAAHQRALQRLQEALRTEKQEHLVSVHRAANAAEGGLKSDEKLAALRAWMLFAIAMLLFFVNMFHR